MSFHEQKKLWKRPRPKSHHKVDPQGDVDFMFLDADYRMEPNIVPGISKLPYEETPTIEIFGVTAEGLSVNAHVHGFLPYFYADSSTLQTKPCAQHPQICDRFLNRMEGLMKDRKTTGYRSNRGPTMAYTTMENPEGSPGKLRSYVHSVSSKKATSIYGHQEEESDFFRITMLRPTDVPAARTLIMDNKKFSSFRNGGAVKCYEANVEFIIRFMVDAGITGCGWITAPRKKFHIRRIEPYFPSQAGANPSVRKSSCDLEFDIHWEDLIGRSLDDPAWQHVAPLVVVSMDAEMRNAVVGHFPSSKEPGDMVISIANHVKVLGEKEARALNVFMVGTSEPLAKPKLRKNDPELPEPVVYSFDTESDMLRAWYDYITAIDADIITGYNIYGFDMQYIEERMQYDKIEVQEGKEPDEHSKRRKRVTKKTRFHRLGRFIGEQTRLRSHKFQNNAYGKKNYHLPTTPGRIQVDCLEAIRRDVMCKFRSYRLDAVSDEILGLRKVDVHYKEITPLFEGTDADRARLGEYNLMDVVLPDMLLEDKAYLFRFVEEARVCNIPMQWILTKGQQVKVTAQILRETIKEGLLIPMNKKHDVDVNKRKTGFTGAIVIDPMAGYYKDAVIILDFKSLYPSIMRRWNLCYTTWIPPGSLRKKLRQGIDYEIAPNGHAFLKTEVKEGLLPRILANLLNARGKAKKDMAAAADKYGKNSAEYKRQDGRQNALKVSANSVYGFTGALVGRLPCLPISSAVTGYGRQLIEETKAAVEAINPGKYVVIYGDTDSVMVRLVGVTNIQEALDIGDVLTAKCAEIFQKPVEIAKEKVFLPYALFTKKRYAGLHWERSDFPYYINSKGLITVRRDNALFASNLFGTCLNTLYGYNNSFDNRLKFVESEYPAAERGDCFVMDSRTGETTLRRDEELASRDKGDIYAKLDLDTGEILRPGWVVQINPQGKETKIRVGDSVDTIYTIVVDPHGNPTEIEQSRKDSIAERTRGLVFAKLDRDTGEVLQPGWIKKRAPHAEIYKEWLEMVGDSVQTAIDLVQNTRKRLWAGEIPLDMLTISKTFSREASDYASKQPHVELALRMNKRDAGSAPKVGDRVPYVVVRKGKKSKLCDKTEDPAYVEEHGVPMDFDYYDSRQLKKPITQLFAPILAKKHGETYVAPQESQEDDDDEEMTDYIEEEGEATVFDRMMEASGDMGIDSTVVAERILFPTIARRVVEIKGASVLYDPKEDVTFDPFEFFSLPPAKQKRRRLRKSRGKKIMNAFDLLLGQAQRDKNAST